MRIVFVLFCLILPFSMSAKESRAALQNQINALKRALSEDPLRMDMRYRLSVLQEQAGYLEGARQSVREILQTAVDHFDSVIRDAWLSLCLEDYKAAESGYRRAAALRPDSMDARLGLQLVYLRQENWTAAKSAGLLALKMDKNNYWAASRYAYTLFMSGDFDGAATWYEALLEKFPDDLEMLLGMGFARIRLGQIEEGKKLCHRAERISPEDPRVKECLREQKVDRFQFGADGRFSYLRYVYPATIEDIKYTTLTAWGLLPSGLLLWGGAGFTQASMPNATSDYYHIPAILGIGYRKPKWSLDASGGYLFSNNAYSDGTGLARLAGAFVPGKFGGALRGDVSIYPDFFVVQLGASLLLKPIERIELSVGPEVILVSDESKAVTQGQAGWGVVASGHVGATLVVHRMIALMVTGFGGPQTRMVEASGLSIWTNDDRFMGGYTLGIRFQGVAHFCADLAFVHYIGVERQGLSNNFHLPGVSVGLSFNH